MGFPVVTFDYWRYLDFPHGNLKFQQESQTIRCSTSQLLAHMVSFSVASCL
jgi:hypothetical protein